jgi:uncharacterized protein YpmB
MTTSYEDDYTSNHEFNPNEFKIWVYLSLFIIVILFAIVMYFAVDQRDKHYRQQQAIEQIKHMT